MITREITITTDASGDGSGTAAAVVGALYKVVLVDGDFADGVDLTLTSAEGALSETLLVIANWNTDQALYPRVVENSNTDGSALTSRCYPLVSGVPTAVIAQGGDTKTGTIRLYMISPD